jgi:hypothetical protein
MNITATKTEEEGMLARIAGAYNTTMKRHPKVRQVIADFGFGVRTLFNHYDPDTPDGSKIPPVSGETGARKSTRPGTYLALGLAVASTLGAGTYVADAQEQSPSKRPTLEMRVPDSCNIANMSKEVFDRKVKGYETLIEEIYLAAKTGADTNPLMAKLEKYAQETESLAGLYTKSMAACGRDAVNMGANDKKK